MRTRQTKYRSIILGADPGKSGAIVAISTKGGYIEMSRGDDTEMDQFEMLSRWAPRVLFALIEKVHSMPKQGVASSFKFGESYGFLKGLFVGTWIRHEFVTPQKWQKEMGCLSRGDKNVTKRKAQQLFPTVKVTHRIADALLLAEYARREALKQGLVWNPALEKDVDKPYLPPSTPYRAFRQEKRISSYLGEEKRFLGHSEGSR